MADHAASEQGFNESELADIMDEIEDLEKEFVGEKAKAPAMAENSEPSKDVSKSDSEDNVNTDNNSPELQNTEGETPEMDLQDSKAVALESAENTEEETNPILSQKVEDIGPRADLLNKSPDIKHEIQKEVDQVVDAQVIDFPKPETKQELKPEIKQESKVAVTEVLKPKSKEVSQNQNLSSISKKSQMEFKISGDMEVQLKFCIGKNEVMISVEGKEGLKIKLENGATFTIPLNDD